MAGYIGKSQGVTQVDGYNRTEADDRYVNASGDTMTGGLTVNGNLNVVGSAPVAYTGMVQLKSAETTAGDPAYTLQLNRQNSSTAGMLLGADSSSNAAISMNGAVGLRIGHVVSGAYTERFKIDSAGRVTMPYQPAFDVATTNIAAINTSIVFNVAYVNRGNHFNTSTGTFTAPVAGAYHFTYSTIKDAGSTNEIGRFVLAKNGVVMNGGRELRLDLGQEYGDNGSQVWIINMNAGDYVNIKVGSSSNSSNYGGVAYNGFTGYLIG